MPTCSIHCALSMCDIFGDAQLLTHALTNLRISGGPWVDFQLKLVQNKNLFRQRHQDQPYHSLKVDLISQSPPNQASIVHFILAIQIQFLLFQQCIQKRS